MAGGGTCEDLESLYENFMDFRFHPGSQLAASMQADKSIKFWDFSDDNYRWYHPSTIAGWGNTFYDVAFSPDGRLIYTALETGEIGVWGVRR